MSSLKTTFDQILERESQTTEHFSGFKLTRQNIIKAQF